MVREHLLCVFNSILHGVSIQRYWQNQKKPHIKKKLTPYALSASTHPWQDPRKSGSQPSEELNRR